MSRLPKLSRETLEPAAQAVWDRIASGARGGVGGPFTALILSPELCGRVEQLGVFIRYECSVPMRLRELAILCVGQHWKADYEWFAHAPIAAKQGVPDAVIAAVGAGAERHPLRRPGGCDHRRLRPRPAADRAGAGGGIRRRSGACSATRARSS